MPTMTCPYCHRPMPERANGATCGRRKCQLEHRRKLSREYWRARRATGDIGPRYGPFRLRLVSDPAGLVPAGGWFWLGQLESDLRFYRHAPPAQRAWQSGAEFADEDGHRYVVAGHELVRI